MEQFRSVNFACSKLVTTRYSTSFSMGIRAFARPLRGPIYGIYGFVRYADEIVDTFHGYDKAMLLAEFRVDAHRAIARRISLNPILDSFQFVVHNYNIEDELINAFLDSMAMDLTDRVYDAQAYERYIYGSAEVVGLMCLRVFTKGNPGLYDELRDGARSLGAAFQKVNFLRDLQDDFEARSRTYFPGLNLGKTFTTEDKQVILSDIKKDFSDAYACIIKLPPDSRPGVMLAYRFYSNLLAKIERTRAERILQERIRVNNFEKAGLLASAILIRKLRITGE